MKNPSPFPKFPKGLSTKEVRQEIQRRMEIMDQMGLIRKSKNSKANNKAMKLRNQSICFFIKNKIL